MKRDDIVAFPYTNAEIAAKIDFTPDYAAAICYLLEHGARQAAEGTKRSPLRSKADSNPWSQLRRVPVFPVHPS
jgi:hypothetical protein